MSDKQRKSLRQKINDALDIPDVSSRASLLTLRGRSELSFGGASSISLYTTEQIVLALRDSTLSIIGADLVCSTYHKDEVIISGRIDSITFCDSGTGSES